MVLVQHMSWYLYRLFPGKVMLLEAPFIFCLEAHKKSNNACVCCFNAVRSFSKPKKDDEKIFAL